MGSIQSDLDLLGGLVLELEAAAAEGQGLTVIRCDRLAKVLRKVLTFGFPGTEADRRHDHPPKSRQARVEEDEVMGQFASIQVRLADKIEYDTNGGCWLWAGAMQMRKGYGTIWYDGRSRKAHAVSYELNVGKIAEGLEIDHLCKVTSCINPRHLEVVTPDINKARSNGVGTINAAKTHCVHGHAFTPENTYQRPGRNWRICRECQGDMCRKHRRQKANAK